MKPAAELFDQISQTINEFLPQDLTEDARKNIKAAIAGIFDRLDLVTREELEVQEALLKRTREKLEQLEEHIRELEKSLAKK